MQGFANEIADAITTDPEEDGLHARIRAEFAEMPGLRLTLAQASRLFNIDAARCERTLAHLVASGSLAVTRGAFVRGRSGRYDA